MTMSLLNFQQSAESTVTINNEQVRTEFWKK